MPSLTDYFRKIWRGPVAAPASAAGIGLYGLGGVNVNSGSFIGQSWDFLRIHQSVYSNPTGYRCIEAIASNFSRPPWMILPRDAIWPQLSNEIHEVKGHPLLDVLNQPAPGMSATQLQRAIARDLELTGKFFAAQMRGIDGFGGRGPVTGLRRLPPQRVSVVGNQDDELMGFIYTDRNGIQRPVLPENVLYLRFPHPERIYDGMSPALIAGLPAETDNASSRFNRDLLQNDGALPGYLVLKGMTPELFAKWRVEWEAGALPGKMRFLAGEQAEYVRAAQTNQELTYDKLRDASQDDIMRAFGVPRAVAFDVSHETYANAEREQALFMQHNILSKWTLICDELTQQLGETSAEPVRVALNLAGIDELQDSRDAVTERGIKLMSMKAMTINEFRRSQGWPDVPWGDEPQAPLQPMSAVPLAPGPTNEPAPPGTPPGAPPQQPNQLPKRQPSPSGTNGGNGKR